MADTLPRTEYKLGWREFVGAHWRAKRPTHIVKVQHVRIGTSYRGEPMWTTNWNHRALCGVAVVPIDEQTGPDTAHCAKCRRELKVLADA